MIGRFSLYGFLKNQQYFEPFLVLFFLEKGLTFFQIGLLIGVREIFINLLEVPSGAWADVYGRRRAMLISFAAYICSFVGFAATASIGWFFLAMVLYAFGDAFRSGTHKAMIFHWLETQNRVSEKTKVYGYTRSWSRLGSALSVVIAPGLVWITGEYTVVFWCAILPYLANMFNLGTYPVFLDGRQDKDEDESPGMWRHFKMAAKLCFSHLAIRRLLLEAVGYEGLYKAIKDYLQPLLQAAAVAMPVLLWVQERRRTALLVGAVYLVLHLGSAWASRKAHRLRDWLDGDETKVSKVLWQTYLVLFAVMLPALVMEWHTPAIIAFVCMAMAQNFWRPVLVSRIGDHAPSEKTATILSIESQSRSTATMLLAPAMGWIIDQYGFWPLGALGLAVSLTMLMSFYRPGARPGTV